MKPREIKPECILCRRVPERSVVFAGHHLCTDCEGLIVNTTVDDPLYGHVVQSLRAFWSGLAEAAASRDER